MFCYIISPFSPNKKDIGFLGEATWVFLVPGLVFGGVDFDDLGRGGLPGDAENILTGFMGFGPETMMSLRRLTDDVFHVITTPRTRVDFSMSSLRKTVIN